MKKILAFLIFAFLIQGVMAVQVTDEEEVLPTQPELSVWETIKESFKNIFPLAVLPSGYSCATSYSTTKFTSTNNIMQIGNKCGSTALVKLFSCNNADCSSYSKFGEDYKVNGINPEFKGLGTNNPYIYFCFDCVQQEQKPSCSPGYVENTEICSGADVYKNYKNTDCTISKNKVFTCQSGTVCTGVRPVTCGKSSGTISQCTNTIPERQCSSLGDNAYSVYSRKSYPDCSITQSKFYCTSSQECKNGQCVTKSSQTGCSAIPKNECSSFSNAYSIYTQKSDCSITQTKIYCKSNEICKDAKCVVQTTTITDCRTTGCQSEQICANPKAGVWQCETSLSTGDASGSGSGTPSVCTQETGTLCNPSTKGIIGYSDGCQKSNLMSSGYATDLSQCEIISPPPETPSNTEPIVMPPPETGQPLPPPTTETKESLPPIFWVVLVVIISGIGFYAYKTFKKKK